MLQSNGKGIPELATGPPTRTVPEFMNCTYPVRTNAHSLQGSFWKRPLQWIRSKALRWADRVSSSSVSPCPVPKKKASNCDGGK